MTLDEEVVALRAEVASLREALAQAQRRIAELEQRKTPPPPFVRPNRRPDPDPDQPATPRKKRAPAHNAGRKRETPTQIVYHALERCPDLRWSAARTVATSCAGRAWHAADK